MALYCSLRWTYAVVEPNNLCNLPAHLQNKSRKQSRFHACALRMTSVRSVLALYARLRDCIGLRFPYTSKNLNCLLYSHSQPGKIYESGTSRNCVLAAQCTHTHVYTSSTWAMGGKYPRCTLNWKTVVGVLHCSADRQKHLHTHTTNHKLWACIYTSANTDNCNRTYTETTA